MTHQPPRNLPQALEVMTPTPVVAHDASTASGKEAGDAFALGSYRFEARRDTGTGDVRTAGDGAQSAVVGDRTASAGLADPARGAGAVAGEAGPRCRRCGRPGRGLPHETQARRRTGRPRRGPAVPARARPRAQTPTPRRARRDGRVPRPAAAHDVRGGAMRAAAPRPSLRRWFYAAYFTMSAAELGVHHTAIRSARETGRFVRARLRVRSTRLAPCRAPVAPVLERQRRPD